MYYMSIYCHLTCKRISIALHERFYFGRQSVHVKSVPSFVVFFIISYIKNLNATFTSMMFNCKSPHHLSMPPEENGSLHLRTSARTQPRDLKIIKPTD